MPRFRRRRRLKPGPHLKSARVVIACSPYNWARYKKAAEAAGKTMSEWGRSVLTRSADRILSPTYQQDRERGQRPPGA